MEPQTEFDNNIELLCSQYPEKANELQAIKQAFLEANVPSVYQFGDRILRKIMEETGREKALAQIDMLFAARDQIRRSSRISGKTIVNIAAVAGLALLALYYFGS